MSLTEAPALAFIYDREVTSHDERLTERLAACRAYADRMGWHVAGAWVDRGDTALHAGRRPLWRGMVAAMEDRAGGDGRVVCLVADWGRISHDPADSVDLRQMVSRAGGVVVTVTGETDTERGLSARADVVPIRRTPEWAQRASGPYGEPA
ncbi:recombinase family protein [Streptomyces buecherae]|uniref:recombinase family protein n=1 Tax=Streptomyces buecherae TaxID=2763006 RepID=UPI0037AE07B4